ncbi:surfactin synthase thioesterase subunit [Nocardiopsis sp. Huas11]|uniref:thioesterase II family protein n=1 Tax=Nocardiopsis sp. Huas11 TaxID=2183912 RepID=UPI000EB5C9A3|nr:alpha/beta fold hydrolase [Nocardiopsis sp. Huas11]RKS08420.1 surfactin synthase thioesterase subunit [Nocardiopsis sp. Huas11]
MTDTLHGRSAPQAARPRVRLLCLPYAGGGATAFRSWHDGLGPDVRVEAPELPGRESRADEPGYRRMAPLVTWLADTVGAHRDTPTAIYGHSMGALIAFELARELHSREQPPIRLLVSGMRAPDLVEPRRPPHSDDEVAARMAEMGLFSAGIFDDPEFRAFFMPVLHTDLALIDGYLFHPGSILDCPVSVWGSATDPVTRGTDLTRWGAHTRATTRVRLLPGGHDFIHSARHALLSGVRDDLAPQEGPR